MEVDEEGDKTTNHKVTRSRSQPPPKSAANASPEEVDGFSSWGYNPSPSTSGFVRTPDNYVIVFTDGACSQNGRQGAKAGVGVWFNHNNPL